VAGASVAAGAGFSVAGAPPHAVRTIDAMIKRDKMYKSFFMVIFSPHKDLDWTEVFKGKKQVFAKGFTSFVKGLLLIIDNHMSGGK